MPVKIVKNLFDFFNTYEKIWLMAVIVVTIYIGGGMHTAFLNVLALSSFITGCIFVLLVAKGSLWNYPFGLYNALTYAYVMATWHEFGNMLLYLCFFTPMLIIGWYTWYRNRKKAHLEKATFQVEAKRLSLLTWMLVGGGIVLLTVIIRFFLHTAFGLDERYVWLDSFSVATPIMAQILMNLRYAEQWYLWVLVNIANIMLWGVTYVESGGSLADLISWVFFLINSVYGIILWQQHSRRGVQMA